MTVSWPRIGALFVASGIALGAFGAHGLRGTVPTSDLEIFEKAVHYQLIQGLGIMLVALMGQVGISNTRATQQTCMLLSIATIIFSGSLYLLVLLNERWLGAITPIGGALMIGAWAVYAFRLKA
ncbi:MAG: DUF423 domain-containing protein [Oligoflexia bacterium]|nr:DUF423 domain-containing protein [Oligoflexia bacterium]